MGELEKVLSDVMLWVGVGGIALSIVAGVKKYIIGADTYDNTGLLDDYKPGKGSKQNYLKEKGF